MEVIICHLLPPPNFTLQQCFILPEQSSPMTGPCWSRGFGARLVEGGGASPGFLSWSTTKPNCEFRQNTLIKYTDTDNSYLHTQQSERMPLSYPIAAQTTVPCFWMQKLIAAETRVPCFWRRNCLRKHKYSRNNFCSSQMNPRSVLLNNTRGFYRNNF